MTTMSLPDPYPEKIARIPKTFPSETHLQDIVKHYKTLRLDALQLNPSAFGSTYERESQFTYETWLSRVQNPLSKIFVALAGEETQQTQQDNDNHDRDNDDHLQHLLYREWVGQVTLIGPKAIPEGESNAPVPAPWDIFVPGKPFEEPSGSAFANSHAGYVVVGMFVLPHGRKQENGRRLIEAALMEIRQEAKRLGIAQVSVGVVVKPSNFAAQRLYERTGFEVVDDHVSVNVKGELVSCVGMVNVIRSAGMLPEQMRRR